MTDTAAQPAAVPASEAAPAAPETEPQGQGSESEGNELYAPFLEGVPEEIHEQVLTALKAQNSEFTKKFQSQSERNKPFEELGVFDQQPETIGQYLQLDKVMEAAQNGDEQAIEAVYQWWDGVGDALSFYDSDGGDEGGEDTDGDEEFDMLDMTPEKFKAEVQKAAQEMVQPLLEKDQTREQAEAQAAAEAQANEVVDGWIDEVKKAHPQVFEGEEGEKILDEVLELGTLFPDAENPVQAGLQRYQELVGKGEKGLFEKKLGQPEVPEGGGGRADTSPPKITMKNARDVALEYVNNGNQMT